MIHFANTFVFFLLFGTCLGRPRISQMPDPEGFGFRDPFEQPARSDSPPSALFMDAFGDLMGRVGRTFLVSILGRRPSEKRPLNDDQRRIHRSPASTKHKVAEQQHQKLFRQAPSPHQQAPVRSPSLMTKSRNVKPPDISESIDAKPMTISKPSEERIPHPPSEANEMAAFKEAIGKEWKHALFGRSGLLTEIFNFVNDKRKEGLARQAQAQAAPNVNDKTAEFSKILDSLLRKAQTGNFDEEPLPEIPFIGICNRLSCADIYKALDAFRKSEFFSNFQTALSLMQDPKGLDMIGELLANPDLIENFSGPEGLGELFGSAGKKVEIAANTDMENFGVDLSSVAEPNGSVDKKVPEIAASIDSAAPDYYSNFGEEKVAAQIPKKAELSKNVRTTTSTPSSTKMATKNFVDFERPLPEISESIDGPIGDEDFPGGEMLTFEKNEWIPHSNGNGTSRKTILTPQVEVRVDNKKPQKVPDEDWTTVGRKNMISTTSKINEKSEFSTTTKKPPYPSTTVTTTERPSSTTTRRNFRRDDDYYSMYYDDGASG